MKGGVYILCPRSHLTLTCSGIIQRLRTKWLVGSLRRSTVVVGLPLPGGVEVVPVIIERHATQKRPLDRE